MKPTVPEDEALVYEYSYLCREHGLQGPFDSMRDCPECARQPLPWGYVPFRKHDAT